MREIEKNLDGSGMRIGIVQSRFNEGVCAGRLGACRARLAQQGVQDDDITLATVPGALEIPLVLQQMAAVPMAVTLFAVVAMGLLLGPLGVLLATPLAIVAYVLVRKIYLEGILGERL